MLPTIFTWRDALDTLMATNPLNAMAYSLKLPTITWWREALDTLAATNPLFAAACSTWADIVTGGSGVIVIIIIIITLYQTVRVMYSPHVPRF